MKHSDLPQQKESRQTAATAWRRAAFRKTQFPSVFSLSESPPKRKFFFLRISKKYPEVLIPTKKLDTIDADTLLGLPYEPLSFVV